jgi:hypothetical protein
MINYLNVLLHHQWHRRRSCPQIFQRLISISKIMKYENGISWKFQSFLNIIILWISLCRLHFVNTSSVSQGIHCGIADQSYRECGSSCYKKCRDLSMNADCSNECSAGCFCPKGSILNDDDICIPISECSCYYEGKEYKPNSVITPNRCTQWWVTVYIIFKIIVYSTNFA